MHSIKHYFHSHETESYKTVKNFDTVSKIGQFSTDTESFGTCYLTVFQKAAS